MQMIWKFVLSVAVFCALVSAGATRAEEPSGCDAFKWSIATDQAALAAEGLPTVEDGGALGYAAGATVRLVPVDKAHFRQLPERTPRPETFAAVVELPPPPAPGVYRISLSDAAWLDAIQDGVALKPRAFSGARDCPHVRKSLRFELSDKPVTIQISNVAGRAISLVVLPK
jgi:hypothetical protein